MIVVQLVVATPESRFAANVVDRVVITSVATGAVLAMVGAGVAGPGALIVVWGVVAVLGSVALAVVDGLIGLTPGRSIAGVRLLRDGALEPVGVGPSLLRAAVLALAGLPTCGLGTAMLAWTALVDPTGHRRGWHDRLCGSVVARARPEPIGRASLSVDDAPSFVNLTAMDLLAPVEPAPVARGPRWRLQVDTGSVRPVTGPLLLGRRPEPTPGEVAELVALASPDLSVSKTHALVDLTPDGGLVVTDRGSTNGTTVVRGGTEHPLTAWVSFRLADGDLVLVGDRVARVSA